MPKSNLVWLNVSWQCTSGSIITLQLLLRSNGAEFGICCGISYRSCAVRCTSFWLSLCFSMCTLAPRYTTELPSAVLLHATRYSVHRHTGRPEIIDKLCDCNGFAQFQHIRVCYFHRIAGEIGNLRGRRDSHGHSFCLSPDLASAVCKLGVYKECQNPPWQTSIAIFARPSAWRKGNARNGFKSLVVGGWILQ